MIRELLRHIGLGVFLIGGIYLIAYATATDGYQPIHVGAAGLFISLFISWSRL